MQTRAMTADEAARFWQLYTGDRSDMSYDGETLSYPDELADAVAAIDVEVHRRAMTPEEATRFGLMFEGDISGFYFDGAFLFYPADMAAAVAAIDVSEAGVLPMIKATLIDQVNAAAEVERKRYITAGEGQAMTYTEKLAQARAFLAASEPNPDDYPMIANEVGITAANTAAVAQAVVAAYTAWAAIGAAIEKTRMEANKAIAAAADAAAARAIRNNVVWPTAG